MTDLGVVTDGDVAVGQGVYARRLVQFLSCGFDSRRPY